MINFGRQPPAYIIQYRKLRDKSKKPWFNWWMFAAACSSAFPLFIALLLSLFPRLRLLEAFYHGTQVFGFSGFMGIYFTLVYGTMIIFWGLALVKFGMIVIRHMDNLREMIANLTLSISVGYSFYLIPFLTIIWTMTILHHYLWDVEGFISCIFTNDCHHGPWHFYRSQVALVSILVSLPRTAIYSGLLALCFKFRKFCIYKILYDTAMYWIIVYSHIPLVD